MQAGDSWDKQECAGAGAAAQPASMREGAPVRKHLGLSPSMGLKHRSAPQGRRARIKALGSEVFVPDPAQGQAMAPGEAGAARAGRARRRLHPSSFPGGCFEICLWEPWGGFGAKAAGNQIVQF